MLALDAAIDTDVLSAIALVLCLPGLSLLLLGVPRTRSLTFPLLLGAFMIPVPSGAISLVHLTLRHISAWGSHQLVGLYGIPVLREGTTMLLPNAGIEVADACSGVSTLYAAVLLALILAYMARSLRQAVVLLAASVVLAIICNTIRVFALILIVHYWGVSPLETPLHELTGMVSFVIVLAALFFLARPREMRGAAA